MKISEYYGIRVPEIVFDYVDELENGIALDIGCNSGIVTEYLGSAGYKTIGIDICLPDECKNSDNIEYIQKDIRNFKFKKNYYDVIVALNILQFLSHSEKYKFIELIIDSLKIGGTFVMKSFTTLDSTYKKLSKIQEPVENNLFKFENGVISFFNSEELKPFLDKLDIDLILYTEEVVKDDHSSHDKHNHGMIDIVCKKKKD